MQKISYRRAVSDDLSSIVAIYNSAIEEGGFTADLSPFTVDEKRAWFDKTNQVPYGIFVVETENKIVGYFYFSAWRGGREALSQIAELSFYLHPSARGKGLGQQVLTWANKEAQSTDFQHLIAILLDINHRSIHLLKKNNFQLSGQLPNIAVINKESCGQLILLKKL